MGDLFDGGHDRAEAFHVLGAQVRPDLGFEGFQGAVQAFRQLPANVIIQYRSSSGPIQGDTP